MPTTVIIPDRTYIITNLKSNTVLDLSATDGGTVSGWQRNGGRNQKWTLVYNSDDQSWTFWSNFGNSDTPACLAVDQFGIRGHVVAAMNDKDFSWHIMPGNSKNFPSTQDTFRIFSEDYQLNADLTECGNPMNGTRIEMWPQNYDNGDHQLWTFEEVQCERVNDNIPCSISFTPSPSPTTTTTRMVESGLCPTSTTVYFSPFPSTTSS